MGIPQIDFCGRRGQCRTAADVYSTPAADKNARCDLHARWSPDGSRVSFDTTHNGRREIYELDMAAVS